MRSLEDVAVNGKTVLVRIGADVPLSDGDDPSILDDTRLRASLDTIHYLLNRHAKVVLLAHLGRPGGQVKKELSLRPVYLHLSALLKKPIKFAPQHFSDKTKQAIESLKEGEIVGLENLRFDKGEDNNSRTFAKKLANYGDIYVNDAFSAHHEAASIVAITEFLPSYAGHLMEREIGILTNLLRHPSKPFVAIIGGVKIADKLPAIAHLASKSDRVIVGGAVANTLLAARGVDVKNSLVDKDYLKQATQILKRFPNKIILPKDFVWDGDKIADIGEESIHQFLTYLKGANTVFWNGSLGRTEDEPFDHGSNVIAKYLADSPATTIIGGGNTVEIISRLKLLEEMSFISTGGGATLELLSGKTLPSVKALD